LLIVLQACMAGTAWTQTVEAEKGTLTGTAIATTRNGFTGTGYVNGFDAANDAVSINITAANAGLHTISIRYAAEFGDKNNFVFVNGANIGSPKFLQTSTFQTLVVGKTILKKGVNVIKVVHDWGYVDIDNISIAPAAPADFRRVDEALVTPNPSTEADSLYRILKKNYGKNILSGQYGGSTELNYILTKSAKRPAIRGFDLMDYSPSRVERGASSTETENVIAWHTNQKGISTVCWHWNAPKDLIDEAPDKLWWSGFYTRATTFDPTIAMNDDTSEEYELIIRDIDVIAVQLKRLQAENIPVLWRPLHEADGTWFWWGSKGPEACKWLWRLMFDRLVNHHELNNLIWVWTSSDKASALDWYPGNEYVDMIGADVYLNAGNYSSSFSMFDNLVTLFEGRKIIALSEVGTIPEPADLLAEGAAWSWFATWSGDFITDGNWNSTSHVSTVFKHNYVITLDELTAYGNTVPDVVLDTEAASDTTVELFPNPINNDEVIFEFKERVTQLQIFNQRGQLVIDQMVNGTSSVKVNFRNQTAGMYYAKIKTARGIQTIKLIKK
jgi:mannan endo-1,4-beta-mannosidase